MLHQNDLKIIEKLPDCYILLHRTSNKKLFYKESEFHISNQDHPSHILSDLSIRNTIDHQNLLKLYSFHNETHNFSKSDYQKIALIYEYSAKTFSSEIDLRFQTQIHWTEEELLNTLEVLLYGLDHLHCNGLVHGNINKHSIIYSNDGFVKLADQFMLYNGYKKTTQLLKFEKNSHISPELLKNQQESVFPNSENDIWQLGMIFLESALLKSCLDLIDWKSKNFNFQELGKRIKEIENLQSRNLAIILRIMLNENPEQRFEIMSLLKTNWPKTFVKKLPKQDIDGVLKNSQAINISLNPTLDNLNQEKSQKITPTSKIISNDLIIDKENFFENCKQNKANFSENLEINTKQKEIYKDILQMLDKYENPSPDSNIFKSESLENLKNIEKKPNFKEKFQSTKISNNLKAQYMNSLEGILEESDETLEDIIDKDENKTFEKTMKIFSKKGDCIDSSNKLKELQNLFEQSRARTNNILAKGKLIPSTINNNNNEIVSNNINNSYLCEIVVHSDKKDFISIVSYQNKDKYEGDLKNETREGFGVYYKANGQILYQGEWHNNMFQGTGILNNLDVCFSQDHLDFNDLNQICNLWLKYEGEFSQGKKQGNGVLLFSNKEYFQGCFKNDKIHGFGCFHRKNGSLVFAEWKDSFMIRLL